MDDVTWPSDVFQFSESRKDLLTGEGEVMPKTPRVRLAPPANLLHTTQPHPTYECGLATPNPSSTVLSTNVLSSTSDSVATAASSVSR